MRASVRNNKRSEPDRKQLMPRSKRPSMPLCRFSNGSCESAEAPHSDSSLQVVIGGESEGGYYHSYYLSKDGLCYEVGRKAGYGSKPDRATQASVRDVIASYAREGRGDRDPAKVRKIVDWLTEEVNRFA
jgi:hypothetical protein